MANQKFNLDKGGSKRKFDLHKDLEDDDEKVAAVADQATEAVNSETEAAKEAAKNAVSGVKTAVEDVKPVIPEPTMVELERPVKKSNLWLWICIVIAILLAIMAFAFVKCNGNNGGETVATEQTDSSVAADDDSLAMAGPEINESEENVSPEGEATPAAETTPADESSVNEAPTTPAVSGEAAAPAGQTTPAVTPAAAPATAPAATSGRVGAPKISPNAPVSSDVPTEALRVIRGDYGVGRERREKLGDMYSTVQGEVNNLKRQGRF